MKKPFNLRYQDHQVQTERLMDRVQIIINGEIIADTSSAVKVFETGYNPVIYVPKNDIKEIDLIKSGEYLCPYKGHAELYDITFKSQLIENAALSYDDPYDNFPELQGRVAFYPHKIQEIRIY